MIVLLFLVILTTKFPVFICNSAVLIWNKSLLIKVPLCFQNTDNPPFIDLILTNRKNTDNPPFIDLILTNRKKYFQISGICKSCINPSNGQIQELKIIMKIVSEITWLESYRSTMLNMTIYSNLQQILTGFWKKNAPYKKNHVRYKVIRSGF